MDKQRDLLNKMLVFGIVFLFIGISVVTTAGNIIDNISSKTQILNVVDNSQDLLSRGTIAYGYIAYSGGSGYPEGPCYFPLFEPNNITSLGNTQSENFLTGGTWACDDRWFGIEYMNGIIWEIDPDTGDMWSIGGGGSSCSDLAYNPVNKKLYSVCGSAIFEINITTGEQYLICDLSDELNFLIGIAFDKNGVLYGWNDSSLWTIDIETCEATLEFGIPMNNVRVCHFDWATNELYLTAYTSTGQLFKVDMETGELTLIGNFEGGAEITAFAISFDCLNQPPSAPEIDGPIKCKPWIDYDYTFVSIDPDGDNVLYYIEWGDYTFDDWFGPYESDINITKTHTWPANNKTYVIRAKAKDIYLAESDWGYFEIEIPRLKAIKSLFSRLIEQYQILEVFLRIMNF